MYNFVLLWGCLRASTPSKQLPCRNGTTPTFCRGPAPLQTWPWPRRRSRVCIDPPGPISNERWDTPKQRGPRNERRHCTPLFKERISLLVCHWFSLYYCSLLAILFVGVHVMAAPGERTATNDGGPGEAAGEALTTTTSIAKAK